MLLKGRGSGEAAPRNIRGVGGQGLPRIVVIEKQGVLGAAAPQVVNKNGWLVESLISYHGIF